MCDNSILRQCRERLENLKREGEAAETGVDLKSEAKESEDSPAKRQCSGSQKLLKTMEGDVSLVKALS